MTPEQESALLKLVDHADALAMVGSAVAAVPNVSAAAITKTLTVGGLTTAAAQLDDAIAKATDELNAATEAKRGQIAALQQQKAQVLAQRKSLLDA